MYIVEMDKTLDLISKEIEVYANVFLGDVYSVCISNGIPLSELIATSEKGFITPVIMFFCKLDDRTKRIFAKKILHHMKEAGMIGDEEVAYLNSKDCEK